MGLRLLLCIRTSLIRARVGSNDTPFTIFFDDFVWHGNKKPAILRVIPHISIKTAYSGEFEQIDK